MIKKIIILIFVFNSILSAGSIKDLAESFLVKSFGEEVFIELIKYNIPQNLRREIEITVKQRFYTDFVYLYTMKKNNEIIGYALLDNVLGKVQPITFLVIYDKLFNVTEFKVLKYREEHGGEVANEVWQKQFKDIVVLSMNWKKILELLKIVVNPRMKF